MLKVLYEDDEILVVIKPAGVESQAAKRFAPDMVSEVKNHMVINKSCTPGKEPYVGVIHRLDKPVSGVMVYAKTKRAAAALSEQVQSHKMKKIYTAVVYGKPVNTVDNYVDYLVKTPDGNYSQVVDKGITGAKKAELSYEVLKTIDGKIAGMPETELNHVICLDDESMDISLPRADEYQVWYAEADIGQTEVVPISDTENATMLHTGYIINKNMKKGYPLRENLESSGDHISINNGNIYLM